MKEYYVTTQKLCVGYPHKPVVKEIEIGIRKGEILTLIGPNGAGKSTVLKSIAGQLALLGGTVYLDGRDRQTYTGGELSRCMAVLWTQKLQTELMTCEDVVATGRYPYTGRFGVLDAEDWKCVQEAMELVHISELRERDFTCISDGQRQQVMLARAICQEPEILILDEPTSYLDVRHKLEFLSVLQTLCRQRQLTVLMSLHELDLAAKVSDRLLCLAGEYVERFGAPETIFQSGYLTELFDIRVGSYDEENGCMELASPEGEPEVFVIGGMGSARNVYRRLQRQGTAFATGILYANDLDYPVAKALAAEVLAVGGLESVPESLRKRARERLDGCRRLICCREAFGSLEDANRELLAYAVKSGTQIEYSTGGMDAWQR